MKVDWSPEEEEALEEAVELWGTRWSEVVKVFPGRTDLQIKNRWNSIRRSKDRQRKSECEQQKGYVITLDGPGSANVRPIKAKRRRLSASGEHEMSSTMLEQQLQDPKTLLPQIRPSGLDKRRVADGRISPGSGRLNLASGGAISSAIFTATLSPPPRGASLYGGETSRAITDCHNTTPAPASDSAAASQAKADQAWRPTQLLAVAAGAALRAAEAGPRQRRSGPRSQSPEMP